MAQQLRTGCEQARGELLDETDGSGNVTNEYVYFGGKRIAWRDSSGNIHYYAEDFLGNSRVVMTSAGTVCYDADFYPYGGERVVTDSCDQSFKFTGKERDPETGNDYFGARFYSSSFGRFLSPDWSATVEPVPYAKLDNPQSLNLYLYVGDNPESLFDPDGHLQHKAVGHQEVMQPCNPIGDGPCTWTKETIAPPNAPVAGATRGKNNTETSRKIAERLVMAGEALVNVEIARVKLAFASGMFALSPETGGAAAAVGVAATFSASGNIAAAGVQTLGAISGHTQEFAAAARLATTG